ARAPVRKVAAAVEQARRDRRRAEDDGINRNRGNEIEDRSPPVKWRDRPAAYLKRRVGDQHLKSTNTGGLLCRMCLPCSERSSSPCSRPQALRPPPRSTSPRRQAATTTRRSSASGIPTRRARCARSSFSCPARTATAGRKWTRSSGGRSRHV